MKSKISFFNKTIFWKNVTLYWPIWAVYSLCLIGAMPFNLWLQMENRRFYDYAMSAEEKLRILESLIEPRYYTIVIAFAAVFAGMALFSYLYRSQSANMIHSLPVDRTELFGTNVISGMAFLVVPQVTVFVLTVLMSLAYNITRIEYLGMWLLYAIVTAFIAFSIVTFCAFLTGQAIAMPIYVVAFNFLIYAVNGLISAVVTYFAYGVSDIWLLSENVLKWFSPLVNYVSNVYVDRVIGVGNMVVGLKLQGILHMIVYFIMAVILYAAAYVIYRIRQIEHAGDLITVRILRPIFRWGVGLMCGFYAALFFTAILGEIGNGFSPFMFYIRILIFGVIFYFIADMFVRKTFHVFKKKNWKGCGAFCILMTLTLLALIGYSNIEEKYVPDEEDVEFVNLRMGYSVDYDDDTIIADIIEIHEKLLENVDYYEELDRNYTYDLNVDKEYITINYRLKNGGNIYRNYTIPNKGEGKEIIDAIKRLEEQPDSFVTHLLGRDYENPGQFIYGSVTFVVKSQEYDFSGDAQKSDDLTVDQGRKLYAAIIADGLEGNLFKYNNNYRYEVGDEVSNVSGIYLEFAIKDNSNSRGIMIEDSYSRYRSINVYFGPTCTNIINVLVEMNINGIDSPDDIYWSK